MSWLLFPLVTHTAAALLWLLIDPHDDYLDERAEAEELRRDEIKWAHDHPPEIGDDK